MSKCGAKYKIEKMTENSRFHFLCQPELPCFNRCCADLDLPITPWDARRLQKKLALTDKKFCAEYLEFEICQKSGLPLAKLKMLPTMEARCPFSCEYGCKIYQSRPAACRFFPLGRSSKISANGIKTQYWLIREPFCKGWQKSKTWSPEAWLNQQHAQVCNHFNDRFMILATALISSQRRKEYDCFNLCKSVLFYQDNFFQYLKREQAANKLTPALKEACARKMNNFILLNLAFDWLEAEFFGKSIYSIVKDDKSG